MKILVVEDSASLRQLIGSYIVSEGHQPLHAGSGEEALRVLSEEDVGLILMDIEMPGLDGFETTRRLRSLLGDLWIPVIFLTGKTDEASFAKGIEAGGDDYLTKPISEVILRSKIRAMERISQMRDQLHQLNAELRTLSQRDSLTGCYNRRTFDDLSRQHWGAAQRYRTPLCLIMLDIDHFKLYNDHYGHPGGDSCLQVVSETLRNCLQRPTDLLARYGGEEFIILLPDTDLDGGRHVAEKICTKIRALALPHSASPTAPVVTVSIGLAALPLARGATLERLISCADTNLYRAKSAGRNQVICGRYIPDKTVMVAANEDSSRQRLTQVLNEHCKVVAVNTGDECLRSIDQVKPDLILLDLCTSGASGADVCKQLRQSTTTAGVPILFISAEADRQQQLRIGREAGANACFGKIFEDQELVARVTHFLA